MSYLKVFVSSFPPKTAYKNGLNIDVYQLTKILYNEAKLVTEVDEDTLNSDGVSGPECGSSILGCDENVLAPPGQCQGGPPGDPGPPSTVEGPPGNCTNPEGQTISCSPGGGGPGGPPVNRVYCGALPPGDPPIGVLSLDCLKKVKGIVINRSGHAWNNFPPTTPNTSQTFNSSTGLFYPAVYIPEYPGDLHVNNIYAREKNNVQANLTNCGFSTEMVEDVILSSAGTIGTRNFAYLHSLVYLAERENAPPSPPPLILAPLLPPNNCNGLIDSQALTKACGCSSAECCGCRFLAASITPECCIQVLSVAPSCCDAPESEWQPGKLCFDIATNECVDSRLKYNITCEYSCKCDTSSNCKTYYKSYSATKTNGTTTIPDTLTGNRQCNCSGTSSDPISVGGLPCSTCPSGECLPGDLCGACSVTTKTVVHSDMTIRDIWSTTGSASVWPNDDQVTQVNLQKRLCAFCKTKVVDSSAGCGAGTVTLCNTSSCSTPFFVQQICSFDLDSGAGQVCFVNGSTPPELPYGSTRASENNEKLIISGSGFRSAPGVMKVKIGGTYSSLLESFQGCSNGICTGFTAKIPNSSTVGIVDVVIEMWSGSSLIHSQTFNNAFRYSEEWVCVSPAECPDRCISVNAFTYSQTNPSATYSWTQDQCEVSCPVCPPPAPPAPTITSVAPTSGPSSGGTEITITGTGFALPPAWTRVFIQGLLANNVVVDSTTSIRATTISLAPGLKDIKVQTSAGTALCDNCFQYIAPPAQPTITSVKIECCPNAPVQGPVNGGTRIKIRGTRFKQGTTNLVQKVKVGSNECFAISVVNDTTITATTPPYTGGGSLPASASVTVETTEGTASCLFVGDGFPCFRYIQNPSGSCIKDYEWTFGEFLRAFGQESNFTSLGTPLRTFAETGVTVTGANIDDTSTTCQLIFVPTDPIFMFDDFDLPIRLKNWWEILENKSGGGLKEDILATNRYCDTIFNPPRAGQGNLICTCGTSPPPCTSSLNYPRRFCKFPPNEQDCCPDPMKLTKLICDRNDFNAGDKFIDIENGVVYTHNGTNWPTNGIIMGGSS